MDLMKLSSGGQHNGREDYKHQYPHGCGLKGTGRQFESAQGRNREAENSLKKQRFSASFIFGKNPVLADVLNRLEYMERKGSRMDNLF